MINRRHGRGWHTVPWPHLPKKVSTPSIVTVNDDNSLVLESNDVLLCSDRYGSKQGHYERDCNAKEGGGHGWELYKENKTGVREGQEGA